MNSNIASRVSPDVSQPALTDRFGNTIDPLAGYARGPIIASSIQEAWRLQQGQRIATERVLQKGPEAISIFTGNQRDFPIRADDLAIRCEEWVGPGIIANDLQKVAIAHMGGLPTDAAFIFNRTSAGIIATIMALSDSRPVVSLVPKGGRSHVSAYRGCHLARVTLEEIDNLAAYTASIDEHKPALVIIITVTSSLERLSDQDIRRAVAEAHKIGAIVFLDDAYGARIRPYLHSGSLGLQLDADISITNCDKAGLCGPRAGALVGRADLVTRISAKGSEFGLEARAPIILGALRSLERFTPELLIQEAKAGSDLSAALSATLGNEIVQHSDLGPILDENDVLALLQRLSSNPNGRPVIVPAEATAALGMVLLRDHGIITTNTHSQPGGRVSLRFKPTVDALPRIGGVDGVVKAITQSIDVLAKDINDTNKIARLILGDAL